MTIYKVSKGTWVWLYRENADDDTLRGSFDKRMRTEQSTRYRPSEFIRFVRDERGEIACYLFELPMNDRDLNYMMVDYDNVIEILKDD